VEPTVVLPNGTKDRRRSRVEFGGSDGGGIAAGIALEEIILFKVPVFMLDKTLQSTILHELIHVSSPKHVHECVDGGRRPNALSGASAGATSAEGPDADGINACGNFCARLLPTDLPSSVGSRWCGPPAAKHKASDAQAWACARCADHSSKKVLCGMKVTSTLTSFPTADDGCGDLLCITPDDRLVPPTDCRQYALSTCDEYGSMGSGTDRSSQDYEHEVCVNRCPGDSGSWDERWGDHAQECKFDSSFVGFLAGAYGFCDDVSGCQNHRESLRSLSNGIPPEEPACAF